MPPKTPLLAAACLLAACTADLTPAQNPQLPGGTPPITSECALFPCDSPWYKDVSSLSVAPESAGIISTIQAGGGWGLGNKLQIGLGYALIHADATTARREVFIQPRDSSDGNAYYPNESDTIASGRGWPVPTPALGHLEGESGYACPQTSVNGKLVNQHDCHLMVVDDSRHLLFELYGANLDPDTGRWYATQESVWNLNYHYGANQRGRGCTSADAAGLPYSAGIIGLRETTKAAQSNGTLGHALRFILPPDRTRRAFVAPASHTQLENQLTSSGPPYGVRLRLRASFDENSISTPGGRAVARTLKKYGMILADGGQTALVGDDESFVRAQEGSSLTWSGLLGPFDLFGLQVTDFEVVDYDASTLTPWATCSGVDRSPLASIQPQGRPGLRRKNQRATPRAPALWHHWQ